MLINHKMDGEYGQIYLDHKVQFSNDLTFGTEVELTV